MDNALLLASFAKLMENSRSMIFVKDANLRYVAASKNYIEAMGREDIIGKTNAELFGGTPKLNALGEEQEIMASGVDLIDCNREYAHDGGVLHCLVSKHVIRDEKGEVIGLLGVYRSLADARLVVENSRLMKEAERDAMTGLLNHSYTLKYLTSFLEGEGRVNSHALMFIDMDNFKSVNDTFGHLYGDGVIKKSAELINRSFRGSDLIGRMGGDEFLVLMKNIPDPVLVCRKAEELNQSLAYDCVDGDKHVRVSASIGVAFYNGDGTEARKLVSYADKALYKAKEAGRDCYRVAEETKI